MIHPTKEKPEPLTITDLAYFVIVAAICTILLLMSFLSNAQSPGAVAEITIQTDQGVLTCLTDEVITWLPNDRSLLVTNCVIDPASVFADGFES